MFVFRTDRLLLDCRLVCPALGRDISFTLGFLPSLQLCVELRLHDLFPFFFTGLRSYLQSTAREQENSDLLGFRIQLAKPEECGIQETSND